MGVSMFMCLPLCNAYLIHGQKQWGCLHLANPIIIYGWPNLKFFVWIFTQYWHSYLSAWVGWIEDGSHSQQWPTTVIHRVQSSVQSTMPHTIHPSGLQVSGICGKLMLKDTSLREFFKITSSNWNGILGRVLSLRDGNHNRIEWQWIMEALTDFLVVSVESKGAYAK